MNETEYFRLSLPLRRTARLRAGFGEYGRVFTKPQPRTRTDRLFWLEAGHGLRVIPVSDIIRLDHKGWFVDQYQDETTVAHIIRLPNGRGFLCAASDPCNDDCFTVLNDAPEPCKPGGTLCRSFCSGPTLDRAATADEAEREAARQAEAFTERLAEDYRDDAEHQTALSDYEENLHPLEKAKGKAEARRDEAEQERDQAKAELMQLREDLAQPGLTPQERQQLTTLEEWAAARTAEYLAEMEGAQDDANDIQDQIDELDEPTAPNFYYFGKAKR